MKTSIFKYTLILFTIILISTSCEKEDQNITTCNIDDPLETIQWLKEVRDGFDMQANPLPKRITQYFYQGECVFLIDGCVGCDDNLTTLYNEDQDVICEFGGIAGVNTCPEFETEATGEIILYGN
ncbi:MAG: hypothetical protein AB8F94_04340 [Saprospiraceae bacterium]